MDELYRHGIKGQKWGVRRYQNSDGTLTDEGKKRYSKDRDLILKSGTNMFRVSRGNESKLYPGSYAAVKSKNDYNKYIGVYAGLLANEGKQVIEKQISAVGDLKIPSRSNSINLMNETLDSLDFRSDIKKQNKLKKYLSNEISEENNKSDRLFKRGLKEFDEYIDSGKIGRNLYDTLNVSFSDKRDNIMRPIINEYISNLKKKTMDMQPY